MGGVLLPLLLSAALRATPEDVQLEREQVGQRRAEQEMILEYLKAEKGSVLELLEHYQRLRRGALERRRLLEAESRALRRRAQLAELEERVAREALLEKLAQLSPRLLVLYRTQRQSPLAVLLPAEDFAGLLWRTRALSRLLSADLSLLEDTRKVMDFAARSARRLDALKHALAAQLATAEVEARGVRAQLLDIQDTLTLIQAQASHGRALVRELRAADEALGRTLASLEEGPATSGFGALKGHLPLPVRDGVIEVGFGRVVNARFKTVTDQKGVDIRAAAGAPVRAVAAGRVVFAAPMRGYGNLLILDHGGGYHTLMGHLSDFGAALGQAVNAGDVVGLLGDTGSLKGAYLYFEVRERGAAVDPSLWLTEARRSR